MWENSPPFPQYVQSPVTSGILKDLDLLFIPIRVTIGMKVEVM